MIYETGIICAYIILRSKNISTYFRIDICWEINLLAIEKKGATTLKYSVYFEILMHIGKNNINLHLLNYRQKYIYILIPVSLYSFFFCIIFSIDDIEGIKKKNHR